jgi:hypothetical protein
MKYKIKNSDLFINNKLHPEGSEIDLTKEQTKGIESYLILVADNSSPEVVSENINENKTKTKRNKK